MTAIREKLNVPSNLRSMTGPTHAQREYDSDAKRSAVLRYIKEHSGQMFRQSDIGEYCGFSTFSAGKYVRRLMAEGRVSYEKVTEGHKQGVRFKWFYHETPITPVTPTRGVKNKSNGVTTYIDPSRISKVADITTDTPTLEATPAPEVTTEAPTNDTDMAFVARLDREIWEYFRTRGMNVTNRSASFVVADFANYMHETYLGESPKTEPKEG